MSPIQKLRQGVEDRRFQEWFDALEARHTADLTFAEIRRGVEALSIGYVERRRTHGRAALSGRGKRAAFGLFYGALHFLLIERMLEVSKAGERPVGKIIDLGCGTGVGGAAWSLQLGGAPSVVGIERNRWAAEEARWTYRTLALRGSVRRTDLDRVRLPGRGTGVLLAFTVNELSDESRERLRERLLDSCRRGATVLVVEPIARRLTPWWNDWVRDFSRIGGVARDWRCPIALPDTLRLLDKGAGLDHKVLTGRSLWVPGLADPMGKSAAVRHSIDL